MSETDKVAAPERIWIEAEWVGNDIRLGDGLFYTAQPVGLSVEYVRADRAAVVAPACSKCGHLPASTRYNMICSEGIIGECQCQCEFPVVAPDARRAASEIVRKMREQNWLEDWVDNTYVEMAIEPIIERHCCGSASAGGERLFEAKLLGFAENDRIRLCASCVVRATEENLVIFSCGLPIDASAAGDAISCEWCEQGIPTDGGYLHDMTPQLAPDETHLYQKCKLTPATGGDAISREEAAQACLDEFVDADSTKDESDYAYNRACEDCADAILRLPTIQPAASAAEAALCEIAELEGDDENQQFKLTRFQAAQIARRALSSVSIPAAKDDENSS